MPAGRKSELRTPNSELSFNIRSPCRHGEMLYNRHDRYIGRSLELYGEFSEAEVELLTSLLRPGSVVIEAGANIGAHTVPLSRAIGDEGSIIAFEPQRIVFDLLCANLALNNIENVHASQRAVGAASGSVTVPLLDPTAEANFGGVSLGHWETGETVPLVSIDDLRLPRLDLIKADVEGMEADVIAGAKATIARHRPILYLENDRPEKRDRLCEMIRSLGYRIWWHTPPLFNAGNFAGNSEDVFEGIASLNILCVPSESDWRPDPALPYLSEQSPQQSVIADAVDHCQAGNANAAVDLLRKAIAAEPGLALYHYHLGNVYWSEGLQSEASECFNQARQLDAKIGDIPFQSGVNCARAGDFEVAEGCLWLALGFRPEHAPTLTCLGDVLRHLGRIEEGLPFLEQAVKLAPQSSEAHANLGAALCELDRLDEAVTALENARAADPSNPAAANNLGLAYKQQGRLDMARRSLDEAVRIAPDFAEARLNRAMTMLLAGDFEAGWREYECRPKAALPVEHPLRLPVRGKTILLHAEQGLGDLIQFVRYADPLDKLGARVIVQCDEAVAPLIRTARGVSEVVDSDAPLPDFDENARLLSLPLLLHPSTATIPVEVPYLRPDPERVAAWRSRLQQESRLRVGFVWGGNPGPSYDRRRSIPLASLLPILREPGVAAYSLQRGPRTAELAQLPADMNVVDLEAESNSILDTAAAMMYLDLIITADTMPAHLAGALGRPVWILLPFAPDWRWMLEREDSPWYPTARLFRQPRPGDWSTVATRVAEALRRL